MSESAQGDRVFDNVVSLIGLILLVSSVNTHLSVQSSLSRLALEAVVRALHFGRSAAVHGAVSRERPLSFNSLSTVLHQVSLGRPLLFFYQRRARHKDSGVLLQTCPNHFHL